MGNTRGRPTKLTPETQKKIVAAIRSGNFFETACEFAGISRSTGFEWLRIARGEHPDKKPTKPFLDFLDAVKKAEADAEAEQLLIIRNAAKGGTEYRSETVNKYDKDGRVKEVIERKQLTPPNWTAAAWYLERKHPERWGRTKPTCDHDSNMDEPAQGDLGGQLTPEQALAMAREVLADEDES